MKRIRFVVTGRVQGVVEGEVEGRDDAVEALVPCLEEGPSSAIVTNVEISEISDDGQRYKQFEIR